MKFSRIASHLCHIRQGSPRAAILSIRLIAPTQPDPMSHMNCQHQHAHQFVVLMGGQVLYELYFTLYLFFLLHRLLIVSNCDKQKANKKAVCVDFFQYIEVGNIQFKTGSEDPVYLTHWISEIILLSKSNRYFISF